MHHRIDSLTSIVALITIGGSYIIKEASWLDPVGGLFISLMVIKAGWGNTRTSLLELADTNVDDDIKESVRKAATKALTKGKECEGVEFRDVQGMKSGQNYLMDVELAVPGDWSVNRSRQVEETVRSVIGGGVRGVKRVKVRFVPAERDGVTFDEEFIPPEVTSQANPEPEEADTEECTSHSHGDEGSRKRR